MTEGTSAKKQINYNFVCLSFGKDKGRGLKVVQGASKESRFDENMEIKAEKGFLRENDTLGLANGQIIEVEKGTYKRLKDNREERKSEQKEIEK